MPCRIPANEKRGPCARVGKIPTYLGAAIVCGSCWCGGLAIIHHILQLFAGLKEGNFLRRNIDAVPSFRIASDARFSLSSAEAAEAANFDLVSGTQRAN